MGGSQTVKISRYTVNHQDYIIINEHHWCQTLGAVRFIAIRNSSDIIILLS
jgi:hypothetical protein